MEHTSSSPDDLNSKNDKVNQSLLELRIQELENQNSKVLSSEKHRIAEMADKIDLISTIYKCLNEVKPITINESKGRNQKSNHSKKQGKSGEGTDHSFLGVKSANWELQKLREEKRQFLAEIKQYKEVLWLQSRTINELTAQQNELMRSMGDYRKGCASRLERMAKLGKKSGCGNGVSVQDQVDKESTPTPLILKLQNKGTQTDQLGVTKAVQCFLSTQNIDRELLSLKKRQSEFSEKFEDIVKMVMVNEAGKVTDRYKKLKTDSIYNADRYTRRLTYDQERIAQDQSTEMQDEDDILDQVMPHEASYKSASIDQTDYFIESKRFSAKNSAPKLTDAQETKNQF